MCDIYQDIKPRRQDPSRDFVNVWQEIGQQRVYVPSKQVCVCVCVCVCFHLLTARVRESERESEKEREREWRVGDQE